MQTFHQIIAQSDHAQFAQMLGDYLYLNRQAPTVSAETQLFNYLNTTSFSQQDEVKKNKIKLTLTKALGVYSQHLTKHNAAWLQPKQIASVLAELYEEKTKPLIHKLISEPHFLPIIAQEAYFYNFYLALSARSCDTKSVIELLKLPVVQPYLSAYFKNYEVFFRAHQKDDTPVQNYVLDYSYNQYQNKNPDYKNLPLILALTIAQQEVVFSQKQNNKSALIQYALSKNIPLTLSELEATNQIPANSHLILQKLLPPLFRKYNLTENTVSRLPAYIQSELLYYHLLAPASTALETQKLIVQFKDAPVSIFQNFHSVSIAAQKLQQFKNSWLQKSDTLSEQFGVLAKTRLDTAQLMVITHAITKLGYHSSDMAAANRPDIEAFKKAISPFLQELANNTTRALAYYAETPEFLKNMEEKSSASHRLSYPEIEFSLAGLSFYFDHIEKLKFPPVIRKNQLSEATLQKKYSNLLVNASDNFFSNNIVYSFPKLDSGAKQNVRTHIEYIIDMINSPLCLSDAKALLMKKMLHKTKDFLYGNMDFIQPSTQLNLYSVVMACVDKNTTADCLSGLNAAQHVLPKNTSIEVIDKIKEGVLTHIQKYALEAQIDKSVGTGEAPNKRGPHKI